MSGVTEKDNKYFTYMEDLLQSKKNDPEKELVEALSEKITIPQNEEEKSSDIQAQEQEEPEGVTTQQKEEAQPDSKKAKAEPDIPEVSLVKDIEKGITQETLAAVTEHTKIIHDATLRAIALQSGHFSENSSNTDLVLQALDIVTDKETSAIIDTFLAELNSMIETSPTKRPDLQEIYRQYLQSMFVAEYIKKEIDVLKPDDVIIGQHDLLDEHRSAAGFLSMPISFYQKQTAKIVQDDKIAGNIKRGGELYLDFLANMAILNLFKEDFFTIF